MKYSEITELSDAELEERVKTERDVLQKLKFAHAISPIENPMKLKATRKVIARLRTELNTRKKAQQQKS